MAICNFCHREFGNAQAVRAHLKGCVAYKAKEARQPAEAMVSGSTHPVRDAYVGAQEPIMVDFDPVKTIQQQVTTERLRLKLREIERAHAVLDDETTSRQARESELRAQRENRTLTEAREREALKLREETANRAHREKTRQQEQLQAMRRSAIQEAKKQVLDSWIYRYLIDSELKARILLEIEKALTPLPVHELPKAELVQIAEAVRDRLYKEHCEAQDGLKRMAEQRQSLIQVGITYVSQELRDIEDIKPLQRFRIQTAVRERLSSSVTGNETRSEVIDLVDDILDEEGFGAIYDEDEE